MFRQIEFLADAKSEVLLTTVRSTARQRNEPLLARFQALFRSHPRAFTYAAITDLRQFGGIVAQDDVAAIIALFTEARKIVKDEPTAPRTLQAILAPALPYGWQLAEQIRSRLGNSDRVIITSDPAAAWHFVAKDKPMPWRMKARLGMYRLLFLF